MRAAQREPHAVAAGPVGRRAPLAALACVVALLPPVLVAFVIGRFAINIPYRDHWAFAHEVIDFWSGRYGLARLWVPSGPHRIVVPKTVLLALVPWTRWDVRVETWVSFGVALLTFVLLADLARRSLRPVAGGAWLWTLPLVSAALFSLAAWHSWTFGWMVNVYLAVLGLALSAWALGALGTTWPGVGLLVPGAAIAAYSYLSGLLLLGLAPLAAALEPGALRDRGSRARVAVATALALGLGGAFFVGYPRTMVSQVVEHARPGAVDLVLFVVRQIGSPLSNADPRAALAWGLLGLTLVATSALVAWPRSTEHRRALLPWLLLAVFAVGNAAATASGRYAGRPFMAVTSRYAMPVAPFWAAVPACVLIGASAVRLAERARWIRALAALALLVTVTLAGSAYVATSVRGIHLTAARRDSLRIAGRCLRDIEHADDRCLQRVSEKNYRLVRRVVPRLAALGLGPFADLRQPPEAPPGDGGRRGESLRSGP